MMYSKDYGVLFYSENSIKYFQGKVMPRIFEPSKFCNPNVCPDDFHASGGDYTRNKIMQHISLPPSSSTFNLPQDSQPPNTIAGLRASPPPGRRCQSFSNSDNSTQATESATPTTSMQGRFQCSKIAKSCDHTLQKIKEMLAQHARDSELKSDEDFNTYQTLYANFQNLSKGIEFLTIFNSGPETSNQVEFRTDLEHLRDTIFSFEKKVVNKIISYKR